MAHVKRPLVLTDVPTYRRGLRLRHMRGAVWQRFFILAIIVAVAALIALLFNVLNSAFGYVIVDYDVRPTELTPDGNLDALSEAQLAAILLEYKENRLAVVIRDTLYSGDLAEFTKLPMSEALPGVTLPPGTESMTIRELTPEQQTQILTDHLDQQMLVTIVLDQVVVERVLETFSLSDSLAGRGQIEAEQAEEYPGSTLYFKSWLTLDFLASPMSGNATSLGVRTALLGTVWVTVLTVIFAFPIGVGAAIYLEEYAAPNRFNRMVETNIRNLAGVPSIIYGLLGLAVFVRALGDLTGGRTILSASLTMALLILPVIIINAQEAIRAVPPSLREASYGLGATKWQTIARSVLPSAVPGILTGTILGMSRAVGETAPLIVVGASTFITLDPVNPFSKFTVLPIQIYNWTARPQQEFRDAASAAIIVLLLILLLLNATAIFLRQRARRRLTA